MIFGAGVVNAPLTAKKPAFGRVPATGNDAWRVPDTVRPALQPLRGAGAHPRGLRAADQQRTTPQQRALRSIRDTPPLSPN